MPRGPLTSKPASSNTLGYLTTPAFFIRGHWPQNDSTDE